MQAAGRASVEPTATPFRPRLWATFSIVAAVLFTVDVVTKIVAVEELTGRGRVEVLGDLFGLNLAYNRGAAFSLGTDATFVISLIAIGAALAVIWFSRRVGTVAWAIALGSLLAGICGNLADRIFREPAPLRGAVVDFFQLPNWPIFNVADICINVGAALILVQAFRGVGIDGTRDGDDAEPVPATGEGESRD